MKTESKPFLTYHQQLDLLKSRGLIVDNDDSAIAWLKQTSYYRLSAYSLTMRTNQSGEDRFYEGSTFDQIVELYKFDRDLRNLLFSASSEIEIHLRAYIAYYHSQKYSPLGYLDANYFEDPWRHAEWLHAISSDLKTLKQEPFIVHHREHKGGVYPFWVITEVCTFGQLSTTYRNLLKEDRAAIAKEYFGISSREYIENWLHCATVLRNTCAHGGRLYNRKNMNPNVKLPSSVKLPNDQPGAYFYVLKNLLPADRRPQFVAGIEHLFEEYPFALSKHLGLPENWKEILTK